MLLKMGSKGQDVVYLQYGLTILCCDTRGFDGDFGNNTFIAVKTFQGMYGLIVDGIVGDATWGKITSETKIIQTQLNNKGFKCAIDGIPGPSSYSLIKEFQKKNNLIVDGMAGSKTKLVLANPGTTSGGSSSSGSENSSSGNNNSSSGIGSGTSGLVPPMPSVPRKKIFIDPGHGGRDPGAVGWGLREKDITLSISLKVGKILTNNGMTVMYSRTTDIYNDFTAIPSVANNARADLFVSIHCNSFADSNSNGTECFTSRTAGSKTRALAKDVANDISTGLNLFNRGPKEAGYAVLRLSKMAAILIETAFISNKNDSQKLKDRQDEFAQIIARCILEYFKG